MKRHLKYIFILLSTLLIAACRKDAKLPKEERQELVADPSSELKGFYLVNEGNMSMNRASLDFLDFRAGIYRRNIYPGANPEIVKGLGDSANDAAIYGSKLYVVVNLSNKVEVMDVKTGKRIKQIDLLNCRYITFHRGKAYVSAYLGTVGDANAPRGIVAQIDTLSLQEEKRIEVGRQPEEMAVVGSNLYVANSGGYTPANYEHTVSVIDLNTFSTVGNIDVAINLHRLKADRYGDLYVSSRGDNYGIASKLFVIDTKTQRVKKSFDISISNFAIQDDVAYFISNDFSYHTGKYTVNYGTLDVKNEVVRNQKFITDGTDQKIKTPYGIAINPYTKDVFVTDSKDHVSPGTLYCFNADGRMKWSVTTGDIPAHFAFVSN